MNGWSNWDTWNCNLHMTNDEYSYRALSKCWKKEQIRDLWLDLFGEGFDEITTAEVDWQEILNSIEDEDDV